MNEFPRVQFLSNQQVLICNVLSVYSSFQFQNYHSDFYFDSIFQKTEFASLNFASLGRFGEQSFSSCLSFFNSNSVSHFHLNGITHYTRQNTMKLLLPYIAGLFTLIKCYKSFRNYFEKRKNVFIILLLSKMQDTKYYTDYNFYNVLNKSKLMGGKGSGGERAKLTMGFFSGTVEWLSLFYKHSTMFM